MPDRHGEVRQDIVKARIEMADFTRLMVAQEIIELAEGAWNVLFTLAVNNVNPLAGVRVVKQQVMAVNLVGGCQGGQRVQLGPRAASRSRK